MVDWNPRSRTSNPGSRSRVAVAQALDYGKRFAMSQGQRCQAGGEELAKRPD
jgi:hypothetical protein